MSATNIEWTDATWNPIAGCSILSAGCTHCYAMQMAARLEAMGVDKYAGLTQRVRGRPVWNGIVREDPQSLAAPFHWRKPRRVFVNSMSDLFHENVQDSFLVAVWHTMADTPRHSYQILTKRPARMAAFVAHTAKRVLPNVWLGTSVENRNTTQRIDELRATPAAIRFVSFEPLIGPVGRLDLTGIDWAIVGGESGRAARPIRVDWIDEIHDQCTAQRTAFFFKQWGAWGSDLKRRPKSKNGRTYRGRTWDEMPDPTLAPDLTKS